MPSHRAENLTSRTGRTGPVTGRRAVRAAEAAREPQFATMAVDVPELDLEALFAEEAYRPAPAAEGDHWPLSFGFDTDEFARFLEPHAPCAPSDGSDLFGGAAAFPAPAVAAPVVKGGPQQPMTRAQLRATQGPLTSGGSSRRQNRSDRRRGGQQEIVRPDPAQQQRVQESPAPKAVRKGATPSAVRAAGSPARPVGTKTSLSIPQVGIASAIGLATIAAPLTGAFSAPAAKTAVDPLPAALSAPAALFPRVEAQRPNAVEAVKLVAGESDTSVVPSTLAAPRTIIVTKASRDRERSVLPGCDGSVPVNATWTNGQIPTSQLCTLWDGKNMLRADAAVALAKLNYAYKQRFGHNLCLTDSYRTLSEQYHLRAIKPGLAARPGTSNHGWGVAIDMCDGVDNYGSTTYRWMRDNGPAYGWENPDWALPGGDGPFESWHWEYMPGEQVGPGSD